MKPTAFIMVVIALSLLLVACSGNDPLPDTDTTVETRVKDKVTAAPSPTATPSTTPVTIPIPTHSPTTVPTPVPLPSSPRTYDVEALGIPRFIEVDWVELEKIGGISKFRSGIGHDFSHLDVYEERSCRSMKHYYFMRSDNNSSDVFSPVNAQVIELIGQSGSPGTRGIGQSVGLADVQVRMRVTDSDHMAFVVILFHIDLAVLLEVGDTISAGQVLGEKSDHGSGIDIAIYVDTPQGKRLVSYFDVINDIVFQEYVRLGIISREMMIIPRKQRDANLLSCTGVYFDHPGSLPGLIDIGTSGEVTLLGGTGYSPQGNGSDEGSKPSGEGSGPYIETMNCTKTVEAHKTLVCSFRYSGSVDRVSWSAPNGDPETGEESNFTTQFDTPGAYVITLEACNKRGCTLKTQEIEVVEALKS